ncbi:MAG TPA: serine/threonine-protein kinase, partial [Acidimicrobiales bacterium]|nr:serine/threonine-protein kinase [Acidimicrobiales bacterium]
MGNGQPEVVEELTRQGFTDVTVVGRGGHALVYRAEQPAFGRTVAVKVLTDADLDPVAFERFERERRALGSMSNHPNILTVYEGGVTRSGQAYLVTEYAPRGNLAERVARRGPVPWPEAVVTGIKLAGALETAHRRGVVHRDVKPENVLLSDYGEPLLGDFGIARITGGFVTSTTIIRASVAHVPPEVLAGERPRPSTDVYSLASTLLTVIWGRPPFFHEDEAVTPLYDRIAREAPPDLRSRGVPGAVCRVLERGLAKRPSDRPPSALALGEELQAAQRAMGQAVTPLPFVAPDGDHDAAPSRPSEPEARPLRGVEPPPPPPPTGPVRGEARRRRLRVAVALTAVAAALAAAVAVAVFAL